METRTRLLENQARTGRRTVAPERVLPVDPRSGALPAGTGVAVADDAVEQGEEIVLLQHAPAALDDRRQTLLVLARGDGLPDERTGGVEIPDVDRDEALGRKVVGRVRTTVVERQREPQQGVGELLRPVVGADVVLDGNVIAVGIERLRLVVQRTDAVAEDLCSGRAAARRCVNA